MGVELFVLLIQGVLGVCLTALEKFSLIALIHSRMPRGTGLAPKKGLGLQYPRVLLDGLKQFWGTGNRRGLQRPHSQNEKQMR